MPNLKIFARRKSGNPLEDLSPDTAAPGTSTFRVIERPTRPATHIYDDAQQRPVKSGRSFASPLQQFRGKSADDLRLGVNRLVHGQQLLVTNETLKRDRESGGTTNSGSSGYNESSSASARYSSSSTLPSSVDQEREREREKDRDNEELYPRKNASTHMQQSVSADADEPLPPLPSFKARAARTFSFGQKHNRNASVAPEAPPPPPSHVNHYSNGTASVPAPPTHHFRDRSMTNSSYASTAKPPQTSQNLDLNLGSASFGEDFGNMFAGIGKTAGRSREELPLPPTAGGFHRSARTLGKLSYSNNDANYQQESEPMFPPRAHNRQTFTPSPTGVRNGRENGNGYYSYHDHDSQDGLMAGSAMSSPRMLDDGPTHQNGGAPTFSGRAKAGYALIDGRPSHALPRKSSESLTSYASEEEKDNTRAYSTLGGKREDQGKGAKLQDSLPHRTMPGSSQASAGNKYLQASAGPSRDGAITPASDEDGALFPDSSSATPKATKQILHDLYEGALFDSSPQGPPSRALRPGHERTESGTPRKMTKAQFEALQRSGPNSLEHSEDEKREEEDDDDEDESERADQIRRQRKKQQANMAVYRQQMKKVTGGGPSDLQDRPRIGHASNSAPAGALFHLGGMNGTLPAEAIRGKQTDEEDDDVPLGILQAHGFPGLGRPPTAMGENDQRRMSSVGSVINGGAGQGNLPPFARRLPADPYFGSSLVNPANRESLAFSSAQSVYGGSPSVVQGVGPSMGHPGGLVGVIASEERAKASRRGSPNASGTYGMPMPGQMPRTMSMGSMANGSVYTPDGYMPGMPGMPMMPMMPQMMGQQDPSQQAQMQNFMAMQMQLMQNVLAMQQQQMGQTPQPQAQAQDYLGVPMAGDRPMSIMSQAPPYMANGTGNQGRAMTMNGPPPSWNNQQVGGQRRPNSAMPGSYAPSGMNIGGPGPGYTPSIAPSERSNVGMPSRYRPVATSADSVTGRSHSMTSSMTLQAFSNQQPRPETRQGQLKSTIRVIEKAKGTANSGLPRPVVAADEDEEDGWAEMARKKAEKKFGWRKKLGGDEEPLENLYRSV
ncbi:hypothetical protein LTR62_000647 [Meristemomyces frigidus]|uniref:Uncharacterized protein n=1 Tax=Meristemomyces frigidus TaxID=1508187 RepID=A0AAN7YC44_9PEZI|nr:hypothetical protein LTR62_000647 [Meristemomyces frigidus]